jgi:hypothetical protein
MVLVAFQRALDAYRESARDQGEMAVKEGACDDLEAEVDLMRSLRITIKGLVPRST